LNLDPIIDATADIFGVHRVLLLGTGRERRIALPRFAFFHAVRETTGLSLPLIGRAMGGGDHTTVMHGIARAEALRQADPVFARKLQSLIEFSTNAVPRLQDLVIDGSLESQRRRVTYHVLNSLERLAKQNPAGFDCLMLWAGSYDPTHHH